MSQNKTVSEELRSYLDCLTSCFDVLSVEIFHLCTKLATLVTRVCNLESITSASHLSKFNPDIFNVFSERDNYKFNIVVHVLLEFRSSDLSIYQDV